MGKDEDVKAALEQLPVGAEIRLRLQDGREVEGVLAERTDAAIVLEDSEEGVASDQVESVELDQVDAVMVDAHSEGPE